MSEADTQRQEFTEDVRARFTSGGRKDPGQVPELFRQIPPARMQPPGHFRRFYDACIPAGTPAEAIFKPTYWLPVHRMLGPWDEVSVFEEAGAWSGRLIVINADALSVRVGRLYLFEIDAPIGVRGAGIRNNIGAEIKHLGAARKWAVLLGDRVLVEGLENEGMAGAWLGNFIRAQQP